MLIAAKRRRRSPVDWRLYSAQVRRAQRRLPRFEHPLLVTVAASIVFTLAGIQVLQALGVGVGSGLRDLGEQVTSALPQSKEAPLVVGEQQVTVSVAPILENVPDFTKTNDLRLSGRIPSFAVSPTRRVVITLNGRAAGTVALAADGRFGPAPLTLQDGSNTLVATLLDGSAEIAATSQTVVVDRVPPALSITRPKSGEAVTGPDVIVEGKTEPGTEVTINDRPLRPNPDGTFTERLTPPAGPLALTILARDKAGNETKTQLSVTVSESKPAAAGTALALTLDRAKVRPGETVVARIVATDNGRPRADLSVTLSVGVFNLGTFRTDASGVAIAGFAAPDHEVDDAAVIAIGGGASARASLTVSTK